MERDDAENSRESRDWRRKRGDIDGPTGRQRRRQRRRWWRRRRRGRQCITPEIAPSLAVRVTSLCCRSVDDGRGRRSDVRVNARERLAASRRHGVCARKRHRASSLNESSHREGILAHLSTSLCILSQEGRLAGFSRL